MVQTYMHHACGAFGIFGGNYVGGLFGSISQLSFVTELSTPFVNGRVILTWHDLGSHPIYIFNGVMMAVSFYAFRIVYYYQMIFYYILMFAFFRKSTFWNLYPQS